MTVDQKRNLRLKMSL